MYDGASLSDPIRLQRATGELRVSVRRRDGESVLDDLRQAGCLKARFPRRVVPGWMDVVMLNTGGGVAGGDRLDLAFSAGPGARVTIAAQAAERFYRARSDDAPSRVRTALSVGEGAALEWLPQETILFDRCALDRRLAVDVAPDASFLGVETLVFGRAAMGETVRQGWLRDLIRVRRGGDLLLHDAIRLDGDIADRLGRAAIGQGAHVVATIVFVAPDAEQRLAWVRAALDTNGRPAAFPVMAGEGPAPPVMAGAGTASTVMAGAGTASPVMAGDGPASTVMAGGGPASPVMASDGPASSVTAGDGPASTVMAGDGPASPVMVGAGTASPVTAGAGPASTVMVGAGTASPVMVGEGPPPTTLTSQIAAPIEAAASAWDGMLVVRILGHDSASVRATVTAALDALRQSRPLPRVWLC